jgi:hypothetical protein
LKNIMSLKEIQLMSKKLYRKIRRIAVEWPNHIMVVQEVVAVVCVDHHPEWVVVEAVAAVDGDRWVVDLISVVAVEVVADIDQVAVVVVMEPEEIMVVELRPTVVAVMVVIWVVVT